LAESEGEKKQGPFDHLRGGKTPGGQDKKPKRPKGEGVEAILARIVQSAELFLDDGGRPYARVHFDDHGETYPIGSERFKRWLIARLARENGTTAPSQKLKEAIDRAAALALISDVRHRVWKRVGWGSDGRFYLDLGDETWRVVQVDRDGWRVVSNPPIRFGECPVYFSRSGSEQALPEPISPWRTPDEIGLTCNDPEARMYVNALRHLRTLVRAGAAGDGVDQKRSYTLLIGALFDMLRPGRDHCIMNFVGPPGSAKTSAAETCIGTIDPRQPPHDSPREDEDDLMAVASSRHVVAFDNVSKIDASTSDALCRLATGGGMEKRKLYTDNEVTWSRACAPIVLTSILPPTSREDFLRRAITLRFRPGSVHGQITREDVETMVEKLRPAILGCLMEAVSCALRRTDETKERLRGQLPAMASMVLWVEAGAPALGLRDGEFLQTYRDHLQASVRESADDDGFTQAIVELLNMRDGTNFEGTAAALLDELRTVNLDRGDWFPRSARLVSNLLDARAALLSASGVTCQRRVDRHTKRSVFTLALKSARRPTLF
jgi:hypothetical protein